MLPSGLPDVVAPEEILARFFNNSKSSRKKAYTTLKSGEKIPKGSIFIPDNHPDLSVSRVDSLSSEKIVATGDQVLAKIEEGAAIRQNRNQEDSRKKSLGAVKLSCETVRNQSMETVSDELPLHHALILGWAGCQAKEKLPNYAEMKDARKKQADCLAENAEVEFFSD